MSDETDTDLDDGDGCQHVDFSDDDPERCGRDAEPVDVGNVTTWLCPEHAAKLRGESAEGREATA